MKPHGSDPPRKRFDIDGPGGERIITTSLSRTAFFGHTQKNAHTTYTAPINGFVAGIYGTWGYFHGANHMPDVHAKYHQPQF
ncbi:hypothetical protein M7I_5922 [Glarea lozoyensis 74030]|uniref:Uncharacterized protein n=1 Tax=Glarea lozoyensis (strain ATCC 74030 / MF5533) TaxID=1104152 RepID=H0ET67_GLAL7|nr:hypothetical protein M7I_5922 [Glarea lozoyensis 74030]